jgi:uncharacterized membrane protein YhaH (DUF805 family)
MTAYLAVLKKYAVFGGRASRREYWMYVLVSCIIVLGLVVIEGLLMNDVDADESVLATLYQLAVFLPTVAAGVRRMHDTDHSGWWILVPFVNFYFSILAGDSQANRFGQDPYAAAGMPVLAGAAL